MTSTRKVNFEYNDDDVLTTRTLTTKTPVAESFVYDDNGLVSSHTVTHGEDVDAYSYTYDDDGNIIEIKKGGATQQSYVYDANNQLIRENNIDTGKTKVYTYDGYGNILSKNEYAYTLGDLGAVVDTVNYSYDTAWKDKLVSYDGQSITYDEIGNPTNYMGAQMTWFARQMQSYTKGNTSITYKYDSDGLRTQKTVNGVLHEYYYVDGKLQFEKKGDIYQIYYRYDSNGRPALAVKHDIAQAKNYYYYLITNTRGDVIETRNGDGNVNAKFTYDAWGKLMSVTDGAGNALPETSFAYQISLKYRGYVYDVETGLYYLQSRYYDPETGRFINADAVEYIGYSGEVLSYNLFAYCENEPVCNLDPTGYAIPYKVLQGIFGAILGGITQYLADLINVKFFFESWSKVSKYISSIVNGAWDAVTNTGFFKKLLLSVGSNIVGQIINKIAHKVNFSYYSIYKTVIDFTIDYVIDEVLNIKSPKTIKEIRTKARSIGIKGTRKLTAYLNVEIFETNIANITISNIKSWIKLLSQGALKKLFGEKVKYIT